MMSATLTDSAYVGHVLDMLNRRADNPIARAWDSVIRDARYVGASSTARAWFESHVGQDVRTLRANAHASGDVSNVWMPEPRTVDASRASFVTLAGSRRDYAQLRVVAATPETLIAVTPWGDETMQVCVYTVREA